MSNLLKKALFIYMVVMTVLFGVMGSINVTQAANLAAAGDLIKTANSSAIYYLDAANTKHPFHHAREYATWYANFSNIKVIPNAEMISYTLGNTIVARPGTKLVQFVEINANGTFNTVNTPEVYAVGPNGMLYKLDSGATAASLYGANWETKILALPTYLKSLYTVNSTQMTSTSSYPTGTLVKLASSDQVYYIDGANKRPVTSAGFTGNHFNDAYVLTVASVSGYIDSTSLTGTEGDVANPIAGNQAPSGTGLTVALNASTPGTQVLPLGSTNVPLMKINLTASNDGAVTLNSLSVKRIGAGQPGDFTDLYLYDGTIRLTNSKTINSTTQKATFTNLNYQIAAGASKTITLVGTIATTAATYTGDIDIFRIESADVSTSASVNGTFPLDSGAINIGAVSAGTVEITRYGSLTNPYVGATDAQIAQFKLAATNEDIVLNRIALTESGTMNNSYLTNLKLYQDTTLLATATGVDSKSLVTFDLSANPYTVLKSQNKVFTVVASISGSARDEETVRTYMDQDVDLYAVGGTYGYGANVTNTYDATSASNYSEVAVQGGQVTVAKNGPVATTYAVNNTAQNLLEFTITAGVNMEIRQWRVELLGVSGNIQNNTTLVADKIKNVRIAATDGSFSTDSKDFNSTNFTNITTNGAYTLYTDTLAMAAGSSKTFRILVDSDTLYDTSYTIKAALGTSASGGNAFSTTAGIKNTDNNQWITDIVPSSAVIGDTMTFTASSLTTSLGNYTGTKTVVKGTAGAELLYYNLTAGSGSDVTVNSVKFAGFVNNNGSASTTYFNHDALLSLYVADVVGTLKLYSRVGSTDTLLGTAGLNSGYVTFTNINKVITKGTTMLLVLKGDISSSAAASNSDLVSFDIPTTSSSATYINAVDQSGNTITDVTAERNGYTSTTATPTTLIKVTSGGNLYVTNNSSPAGDIVVANTTIPVLKLRVASTDESFLIKKLRIKQLNNQTYNRSVDTVKLNYTNQAGQAVVAEQSFTDPTNGYVDFDITANPIYVAANGTTYVNVDAKLKAISSTEGVSGDSVKFAFDYTANFEAQGSLLKEETTTGSDVTGNVFVIHKAIPIFAKVALGSSVLPTSGNVEFYKFSVTASEGSTISLKKVALKTTLTSPVGQTSMTLTDLLLYENGTTLTAGDTGETFRVYTGATATTANYQLDYLGDATLTATNASQDMFLVFNSARTISAGQTNTYALAGTLAHADLHTYSYSLQTSMYDGDSATSTDAKYLSVNEQCTTASNIGKFSKYCLAPTVGGTSVGAYYIWSDQSDSNYLDLDAAGTSSADWYNAYKVDTLGISTASFLSNTP